MAEQPKVKREYDYGNVFISLENCILPDEKLSETPSMKDGLDKEIEIDLRILGCEFIQTAGILLKLPQVAMATGQILLQRFYYSKSFVKHDVEKFAEIQRRKCDISNLNVPNLQICAMACIFLAAKIEESPRRLRDVINVFHHIKQKRSKRPIVAMDYYSSAYFSMKNSVIKAERRVLKELGFCVHVKVPHKIIITYLQILEHEKNIALTQRAWNYMNDGLRTNVFLKYAPEKIGCACIFLAARTLKIVLPLRPPWWELFDADLEEIEEIALAIMEIYSRPKATLGHLDGEIEKARKSIQEKKGPATSKENGAPSETSGSFTPSNVSPNAASAGVTNPVSRSASPAKVSPADNNNEEKPKSERESGTAKKSSKTSSKQDDKNRERKRRARSRSRSPTPPRRKNTKAETGSSYDSDSAASPSPERKRKRKKELRTKTDHSSSDSEGEIRRSKTKSRRDGRSSSLTNYRAKTSKNQRENGHRTTSYNYDKRFQQTRSPRSRSGSRSPSRDRRDKKYEKRRDKEKRRDNSSRRDRAKQSRDVGDSRDHRNNYDRYDGNKKVRR
eukprot:gene15021-16571_t